MTKFSRKLNTKIHHSFKKSSHKINKIGKGSVRRFDKIGKFGGKQINKLTDSVSNVSKSLSSPFLVPVIGICGVGVVLFMMR